MISPVFAKSLVNFGPLTTMIKRWNHTHTYQFFSEDCISAPNSGTGKIWM